MRPRPEHDAVALLGEVLVDGLTPERAARARVAASAWRAPRDPRAQVIRALLRDCAVARSFRDRARARRTVQHVARALDTVMPCRSCGGPVAPNRGPVYAAGLAAWAPACGTCGGSACPACVAAGVAGCCAAEPGWDARPAWPAARGALADVARVATVWVRHGLRAEAVRTILRRWERAAADQTDAAVIVAQDCVWALWGLRAEDAADAAWLAERLRCIAARPADVAVCVDCGRHLARAGSPLTRGGRFLPAARTCHVCLRDLCGQCTADQEEGRHARCGQSWV